MKTGTTLLLLALAGGLLAYVVFWDSARPGTREQAQREAHVLHFDPGGIEEITISGSGETIELQRDDGRWFMKEPVRDHAEEAFVAQILGLAHELRKEAVLAPGEGGEGFKAYGLDQPGLRLTLEGEGAPVSLLFGKETAVEGRGYVKLEGGKEVYVVDSALREWIGRKADDFRERRLSDLDPRHISEVTIETGAGTIRLIRDGVEWELRQPLRTRADATAVANLLRNLLTTEIMAFAPAKGANLSAYGLTEPRATVTLRSESRDEPVRLELGGKIESGGEDVPAGVYARISTRRAVAIIPESVSAVATLTPDELRDRHLLRLEPDIVDRIALRSAARPPVKLQRKGETWIMEGNPNPVNPHRVETMIEAIRETPVSAFVANVASDLPRYGLDHPRLRITFSSYASATTAESRAGELAIATIAFGAVEDGRVYAMVEGEPFIVALPQSMLERIDGELIEWRGLNVFGFPARKVVALAVVYPEKAGAFPRPPVSLKRSGEGWQMLVGTGRLDPVEVESLVNTLSTLTAMRWLPEDDIVLGEVQTLSFQLADGNTYELEIGRYTPPGGEPATVGHVKGEAGFFLLSEPDASALRLWLSEPLLPGETPPPPAATPAPGSTPAAPAPAD